MMLSTIELSKMLGHAMKDYLEFNTIDRTKLCEVRIRKGTNMRVKRVGGTYHYNTKIITINVHVLRGSYKLINNVIRHELAHHIDMILRGKTHHDYAFKEICRDLDMIDCSGSTPYFSDIWKDTQYEINEWKELL